jgi:hypothetical protein
MNKLFCIGLTLVALGLIACEKPQYPTTPKPTLLTTISSDGKLIAVLDQMGTEKPRLRIKWLGKEAPWQELVAPPFTTTVRFGLTGYGLLMTHPIPGKDAQTQLTRWDVSDLARSSEAIFTGPRLAFPIEVQTGRFLVRTCTQYGASSDSCSTGGGTTWLLVTQSGDAVPATPPQKSLGYSQPSVTKEGFFWFSKYNKLAGQSDLQGAVISYAFPDGHTPEVDVSWLNASTEGLECDYQMQRCLQQYNAGTNRTNGLFIYDVKVLEGTRNCHPSGISGWSDGQSLTPDGQAAVMSLSDSYDSPRHVVVMQFTKGQCMPVSINHLNF